MHAKGIINNMETTSLRIDYDDTDGQCTGQGYTIIDLKPGIHLPISQSMIIVVCLFEWHLTIPYFQT